MGRLIKLFALSSQLLNVLLFNGSPDETISGRCYRQGVLLGQDSWYTWRRRINRVFFFQQDHCRSSHQRDVAFAKMIIGSQHRP